MERWIPHGAQHRQLPAAISMQQPGWSQRVPDEQAARRAGGRRRYNQVRRRVMAERRFWISLLDAGALKARGTRARLARQFKVHRSTIGRDVAWLESRPHLLSHLDGLP